jgi:pterin-4a-carbinolamine dehydratase
LGELFIRSIEVKFSRFFEDLISVYNAELDDLRTDSEGKDILRGRLIEKREQLPFLLPMMASNPEMLAVAFHTGFRFMNPLVMESLASKEANKHPTWAELSKTVKLEPWAEKLSEIVLKDADGAAFMVTAACLEYLNKSKQSRQSSPSTSADEDDSDEQNEDGSEDLKEHGDLDGNYGRHGRDDGDDGDDYDLGEAGSDWLAEQGFDRKD